MSEMNPPTTPWTSFLKMLRTMILEELLQDGCSVARYAAVCRDWQAIIEKKTFSRITITPRRLASFGTMILRNIKLVKYIWLCVQLQEYDCLQCEQEESEEWHTENNIIIERAIRDLFLVLSTWPSGEELVLDISVHSPSDTKHHFKNLHIGSDAASKLDYEENTTTDRSHGWVNGKQVNGPSEHSVNRLFGEIEMDDGFWQTVPHVTAVSKLLLRRQSRYRWTGETIAELLKVVPQLQSIVWEPWREWSGLIQRMADRETKHLFESLHLHPLKLKEMILFEDFNETYAAAFQGTGSSLDADLVRTTDTVVAKALCKASLPLEHLSASFIVEASHFFEPSPLTWTWTKLRSLVMTSRLLVPNGDWAAINHMLCAAAMAATRMPLLDTMQLWNGRKGIACVFSYHASKDYWPARISWRSNWDLPLDPQMCKAWELVAGMRASCGFLVKKELLDVDLAISSHGDAVSCLGFLNQVLHPVSLWQIKAEIGD